jgi:hypothetical protein
MKAVAVAARRSLLGVPSTVVLRVSAALGYALAVFTGVALGLWLLISLIGLGSTPISG